MIGVDPDAQPGVNSIPFVDYAVTVPAILGLVELRKGEKPVRIRGSRLGCVVAEQFQAVVDDAISITVEHEEAAVRARSGPGKALGPSYSAQVEHDTRGGGGKFDTVAGVDNDGRGPAEAEALESRIARISVEIAALGIARGHKGGITLGAGLGGGVGREH